MDDGRGGCGGGGGGGGNGATGGGSGYGGATGTGGTGTTGVGGTGAVGGQDTGGIGGVGGTGVDGGEPRDATVGGDSGESGDSSEGGVDRSCEAPPVKLEVQADGWMHDGDCGGKTYYAPRPADAGAVQLVVECTGTHSMFRFEYEFHDSGSDRLLLTVAGGPASILPLTDEDVVTHKLLVPRMDQHTYTFEFQSDQATEPQVWIKNFQCLNGHDEQSIDGDELAAAFIDGGVITRWVFDNSYDREIIAAHPPLLDSPDPISLSYECPGANAISFAYLASLEQDETFQFDCGPGEPDSLSGNEPSWPTIGFDIRMCDLGFRWLLDPQETDYQPFLAISEVQCSYY